MIYNKNNFFTESFNEVINHLSYSKIQFYYPTLGSLPKSFGWLTETGILYAQVILFIYLKYVFFYKFYCI